MISFIWPPGNPLPAGTGGSENYTVGQVRQLKRPGIPAQVVTVGLGAGDGRDEFTGIPFLSVPTLAEIGDLDSTVVTISVVYPFAEPCFAAQPRPGNETGKTRILFAGRLSPEKGSYTLLETLHIDVIEQDPALVFTATTAGGDKPRGKIVERLPGQHPGISVVATCRTPARMAALMAGHDIVVMPSHSQYWHETFGIVSIEAQHSGCRVAASDDGGLPETDCGGVVLVPPDNAEALAGGIREAADSGPFSPAARLGAGVRFTVGQCVDQLLEVFAQPLPIPPATIVRQLEELILAPSAEVPRAVSPVSALTGTAAVRASPAGAAA